MSIKNWILASLLAFFILQLNLYFAWTSRVGITRSFHHTSAIRSFLTLEVNSITKLQLSFPGLAKYFSNLASGMRAPGPQYMLEMKLFIDTEVIAFTLATFVISLVLFHKKGLSKAVLRAVEITFASILPLGIEIYLYDRSQFNIHASDIQVKWGLAWFTNADVLYLSSGVLAIAVFIEVMRVRKGWKFRKSFSGMEQLAPISFARGLQSEQKI